MPAVVWVLTGNSTVNGHMSYLEQRFGVAQFDFSGVGLGHVRLACQRQVSVSAGWQRDLASYQTAGTTHSNRYLHHCTRLANQSQDICPLAIRGGTRDDQGNPTGVPTSSGPVRTSLSFSWQPRPFATLSVTVGENNRTSNIANADFSARTVGLTALFSF